MRHAKAHLTIAFLVATFVASGCSEPPEARFDVGPDAPHRAGDVLDFKYFQNCSKTLQRTLAWDMDGDGRFEQGPALCHNSFIANFGYRYQRPGTYKVTLWAQNKIYGPGLVSFVDGFSSQRVVVSDAGGSGPGTGNQAPVPDFTSDANPGYTERTVHFDAAPSRDPDGRIVKYEWDRDGDGTWDATGATTSYAYARPGTRQVRLRVTDDEGAVATTERAVPIVDGVPPGESLRAAAVARAAKATRFSTAISGKLLSRGNRFVSGRTFSGTGIKARGRMRLKGLPSPLRGKRRARWAAALTTKQRGTTRKARLTVAGYLLLDMRGGDRVCLNGRLAGGLRSPFAGRMAVVGGTGRGRRVRGSARVTVPTARTAWVRGTLNLVRSTKPRRLPRQCRALVRSLR